MTTPSPPGATPTGHYRRTFTDPLGRPLAGKVTLTGQTRHDHDGHSTLPAPVSVDLADGTLDVTLPLDTYQLEGRLITSDGTRVALPPETITVG